MDSSIFSEVIELCTVAEHFTLTVPLFSYMKLNCWGLVGGVGVGVNWALDWLNSDSHSITGMEIEKIKKWKYIFDLWVDY